MSSEGFIKCNNDVDLEIASALKKKKVRFLHLDTILLLITQSHVDFKDCSTFWPMILLPDITA